MSDASKLYNSLYPGGGLCRVASGDGTGWWRQHKTTFESIPRWSRSSDLQNRNLYFGVAAIDHTGQPVELSALHADIDFKRINKDEAVAECQARAMLDGFRFKPSALVRTGGGLHAYWKLSKAIDLTQDRDLAKSLLRKLTVRLPGSDIQCAFPECVLRVPGTRNVKYSPPRLVVLEYINELSYDRSQFEELLADVEEPAFRMYQRRRLYMLRPYLKVNGTVRCSV